RLDLEDSAKTVLKEAVDAEDSSISVIPQATAIELLRQSALRVTDLGLRYRRGELPVHFFMQSLNSDVVRTHRDVPLANEGTDASKWTTVFIRHGSRGAEPSGDFPNGAPIFDCTTLILCDTLGVLDDLVDHFGKILAPSSVLQIVAAAAERRTVQQPRRLRIMQSILNLLKEGRLHLGAFSKDNPYEIAAEQGAVVLDFLPARDHQQGNIIEASELTRTLGVSLKNIVERLASLGAIDDIKRDQALDALGSIKNSTWHGMQLEPGMKVFAKYNTIEELLDAGVLEVAMGVFQIFIDPEWREQSERDLKTWSNSSDTANYLANTLLERLRLMREDGLLEIVQTTQIDNAQLEAESLLTVMSCDLKQDAFVLCDDRFANASATREDGHRIVSLFDLLAHLKISGSLNADLYYATLTKARSFGLFYLPLSSEEILRYLARTYVLDGALVETRELLILRRYLARAIIDKEALAPPSPMGAASISQINYVSSVANVIREVVARLLLIDGTTDAVTKADWVLQNLAFEGLPGYGLSSFFENATPGFVDVEVAYHLTRLLQP
ncbi:MAG: hypothetical protein ACYDA1_03660, partial [Vulcanimicrobiaceae bacterium]